MLMASTTSSYGSDEHGLICGYRFAPDQPAEAIASATQALQDLSAPPVPGGPLFSGAAERAYLILGCLIGAAGGPLQAASRTLLIRLAPRDRIAQCFGLFALTGKVTSFIGPLLIGVVTAVTASQKAGMVCKLFQ